MKTENRPFTFDDLANLAGASATLRHEPENQEAREDFETGLRRLLGQKPGLDRKAALLSLAAEADERATLASLLLESLVEEGPEAWEDRWEETGEDLDWGDQLDGFSLEVEVNAELVARFRELAKAV